MNSWSVKITFVDEVPKSIPTLTWRSCFCLAADWSRRPGEGTGFELAILPSRRPSPSGLFPLIGIDPHESQGETLELQLELAGLIQVGLTPFVVGLNVAEPPA